MGRTAVVKPSVKPAGEKQPYSCTPEVVDFAVPGLPQSVISDETTTTTAYSTQGVDSKTGAVGAANIEPFTYDDLLYFARIMEEEDDERNDGESVSSDNKILKRD
jgi:hypothetical protein